MAFDPAFLELMGSTITVAPATSTDSFSKPTRGTPVTVQAKVSYGSVMEGAVDTAYLVTVHTPPPGFSPPGLPATPKINADDRVTLPDGDEGYVTSVDRPTDADGSIHHQRLRVQRD